MRTKLIVVGGISAAVMLAGFGVFKLASGRPAARVQTPDLKLMREAAEQPQQFVEKNAASKDAKVQTEVTRARLTLAYYAAAKKDFAHARVAFKEAETAHKGTDAMNPDYGTLSDQAAYQAIVCLDADGKKSEAAAEYRKFIETRGESPLVHACFRRLERLNGGKSLPEDEQRLQTSISAQEARIRFETSVCGPKCLEKLLKLTGKPAKDYKSLAKLCKTTDSGTTMEGLREGAAKAGIKLYGVELNSLDIRKLKQPAIWFVGDHYVLLIATDGDKARVYDPRFRSESVIVMAAKDDANFRAVLLSPELPDSELVADIGAAKASKSEPSDSSNSKNSLSTTTKATNGTETKKRS